MALTRRRRIGDGQAARAHFGRVLVQEAASLALSYFERRDALVITSKGQQDMVSEADHAIERLIQERLGERFPDDAFLGEETGMTGRGDAKGLWVVDPLDGTQPFVCGMTTWCVSIAYVEDGSPQLGFIMAPARAELFVGIRDEGAWLNGCPIRVAQASRLEEGLTYVGYSPWLGADDVIPVFERLLRCGGDYYRDGSGALGLCYVACGRLVGYVERHMNAWDALAALAIVTAAGGRTNEFLEGDTLRTGGPVIAGPPALYHDLVELLGESSSSGGSQ